MQNLCSNWSPWCLLSNEINFTQKFFVDKKLWSKQWAKVIFQYWSQSDLRTFESWLLLNYCELFNYPWLTYFKLISGVGDQNLLMVQNVVSTASNGNWAGCEVGCWSLEKGSLEPK